jgi:hypothetical protein
VANKDPQEMEARLWKDLEDHKVGMLGLTGGKPQQLQPMTGLLGRRDPQSLVLHLERHRPGGRGRPRSRRPVRLHQQGPLAVGLARRRPDPGAGPQPHREVLEPLRRRWFPNGKDDPKLTLLRFHPVEADIWINDKGPVRFGLEILKGNAPGKTADGGAREHLELG